MCVRERERERERERGRERGGAGGRGLFVMRYAHVHTCVQAGGLI